MLALFFVNQAFASSALTSLKHLYWLQIDSGQKQLPVPLKQELMDKPLFWWCKNIIKDIHVSDKESLFNSILHPQMKKLEIITDMELSTGLYTFCWGNKQALDNSSKWIWIVSWYHAHWGISVITDVQQNIILQHHSSSIFQKNYASWYMPDTQATYHGLKPQTTLMRAAGGMSRTIDHHRPKKLTLAQQAEVDCHPEVRLLCWRVKSLL